MKLCKWCEKRMWPWQNSLYGQMHKACAQHLADLVQAENQRQYRQWDLRKQEEDRL